jgi:hypothetical protein
MAKPLVSAEKKFLEVVAHAEGDRADYLRVVVPDLSEKREGVLKAMRLAHGIASGIPNLDTGLNELCGEARRGDVTANFALAWLPQVTSWFASEEKNRRVAPYELYELTRTFLAREFFFGPKVIRPHRISTTQAPLKRNPRKSKKLAFEMPSCPEIQHFRYS